MNLKFMFENNYYSQYGQDSFLDSKIFKKKTGGFFIDIGANDGVTYSNTYFFEKHRRWRGICIEPHPTAFVKLEQNRESVLIKACISNHEGKQEFLKIEGYSEMLSGLKDKYDECHLERINRELKEYGGVKEVLEVPCFKLSRILQEYQIDKVDYCSIDTEGGEIEVLESANLEMNEITVLSVENNYYGKMLKSFLGKYNYRLIKKIKSDEIYKKKKLKFWFFS